MAIDERHLETSTTDRASAAPSELVIETPPAPSTISGDRPSTPATKSPLYKSKLVKFGAPVVAVGMAVSGYIGMNKANEQADRIVDALNNRPAASAPGPEDEPTGPTATSTAPEIVPTTNPATTPEGTDNQPERPLSPETPVSIQYFVDLGTLLKNVTYANNETVEKPGLEEIANPDADIFEPSLVFPEAESGEPQDVLQNLYLMRNMAFCIASSNIDHARLFLNQVYVANAEGLANDLSEVSELEPNGRCALTEISNVEVVSSSAENWVIEYDYTHNGTLLSRLHTTLVEENGSLKISSVETLEKYQ